MRHLKVPGITIRIPLLSITSADYVITTWKDKERAFERAANILQAKVERLSDWGNKEIKGRIFNYIKIKIVDFWTPESDDKTCSSTVLSE